MHFMYRCRNQANTTALSEKIDTVCRLQQSIEFFLGVNLSPIELIELIKLDPGGVPLVQRGS